MSNKKSPRVKSPQKNGYCCQSPARNRKGPQEHARYFKIGQQRLGLDGALWQIKMITKKDGTKYKRWVRLK